jgi:NAD+ synthase (glutamine-hydrolysing)
MRLALAQINTTVGDLAGNEARILAAYQRGVEARAELVVMPELATTGYPPRDLLLRPEFVRRILRCSERLAAGLEDTGCWSGYVGQNESRPGREVTQTRWHCWDRWQDRSLSEQDAVTHVRCVRRGSLL